MFVFVIFLILLMRQWVLQVIDDVIFGLGNSLMLVSCQAYLNQSYDPVQ